MPLRGTREEHAERARKFFADASEAVNDALDRLRAERYESAYRHLKEALLAWGAYNAEVRWGGRVRDEDDVFRRLRTADSEFRRKLFSVS